MSNDPFSTARIRLNTQVMNILNSHTAFWNPCCGAVEGLTGVTFATLLSELQAQYSNWTAALLSNILDEGRRQGRYKVIGTPRLWYLNQSAKRVNQRNKVYDTATDALCNTWDSEKRYGIL